MKVLAASAFFLALFLLVTALTPVTLTATGGVSDERVTDGSWEVVPEAAPSRVVVESTGPGVASFAEPELRWPEIFGPSMVDIERGFRADPGTGGYTANGAGRLVIAGVFGNIGIGLLPDSTVKSVDITRVDRSGRTAVTLRPGEGTLFLSPDVTYQRTTSFLWRSISADLQSPEQANLEASVGNRRVNTERDSVSFGELAPKVLLGFAGGAVLFAGAFLLILFGWGLGRSLEPESRNPRARIAVHAAAGVSLFALAANTAAYMTGNLWTSWVLLAAGLVLIAMRHRSRQRLADAASDLQRLGEMCLWVVPPAILLFFPMFYWGSWYAGEYNTDLFQYTLLSSLLKENSLFTLHGSIDAANQGLIAAGAGFEWRSIDTVLASVTSVIIGSNSLTGFALLSCALFLLFALAIFAMATGERRSPIRFALATLLLINPLFVLIFVENYQSHFFFLALVPGLILAFRDALDAASEASRRRKWSSVVLLAAIGAAALASYPYLAGVLLVGLLLAALLLKAEWKAVFSLSARTIGAIVVLLNVGLLAMRQLTGTERYEAGLDQITTNVLLAPYRGLQFPSLVAGTTPYHWRWPFVEPEMYMGFLGGNLWQLGQSSWTPGPLEVVAAVLFLGALVLLVNWRRSIKDLAFVSSLTIVSLMVLVSVYLWQTDSQYGSFKVVWTAAAVVVTVAATAVFRRGRTVFVVLALLPLALLWIRTDLLDRSTWLINRQGAAAALAHSSAQPDIAKVESILASDPGPVALARGRQPLKGSDRDNVIYNQVRALIQDRRAPCRGCEQYPLEAARLKPRVVCAGTAVIVRIGVSDRPQMCGLPRVASGAFTEVYRRDGDN